MNHGQKMFHDFFMSVVKSGKEAEAEALLAEGFRRQEEGTFDRMYLLSVMAKYHALVRPECMDKLKEAMAHFSSQLK